MDAQLLLDAARQVLVAEIRAGRAGPGADFLCVDFDQGPDGSILVLTNTGGPNQPPEMHSPLEYVGEFVAERVRCFLWRCPDDGEQLAEDGTGATP